nr:hypothetical protein [Variovorax guangxiensis]
MTPKKPLAWRRRATLIRSKEANRVNALIRWESMRGAAGNVAQVINSKWRDASAAVNRAAGFREPPEPEPAVQDPPNKPRPNTDGVRFAEGEPSFFNLVAKQHEMSVLEALALTRMALVTNHNVLATDRPDLPRAPGTGWTTNFLREIAAIDAAAQMLAGNHCRTDLGCARCSTCQPSEPSTGHATRSQELQGSRSPDEVRS